MPKDHVRSRTGALRRTLDQREMSVRALAEASGIARSTVQYQVKSPADRLITIEREKAERIAHALGGNVNEWFCRLDGSEIGGSW